LRASLHDPVGVRLVDAIPLTPNGKIDRQALLALAPRSAEARTTREIVAPRTDTEIALAAIWRELLQVQDIGVDDDFFDLGGQSLMAIRAVSGIRDTFDVDVSLRSMFEQPTLSGLAEIIDGLAWISKPQGPRDSGDREEITL
jgi:Phosphopantetheine attachment site.